ncbi:hypothetical protein THSYN_14195 [Candidatus Thiodictyon syntrophicum]|uniref:Uncharacterized protein n=1 Tax=Candidatus Thiodictyon syntrophicum TaxID=1166950 RepID=A0A2K8U986_9GAMM|nr:hypothetical protein THSYN_14195 [Candidatus Thiodictyon syntrophicum]
MVSATIDFGQVADAARDETALKTCRTLIERAARLAEQGDPESLAAAVAAYDEVIVLGAVLDLSAPEERRELAVAHNGKGIALGKLATPATLGVAVDAYDEAIRLLRRLDLSVAQYRNDLATACSNKGTVLAAQGTPAALAAAVDAHDEAIGLRRGLDLSVAKYRNALAAACSNKGNALAAQGTPAALAAAVAAHDEAIGLRRGLDLSVAEYRSDLAGAHTNKGIALAAQGTPAALAAAVAAHDEAIGLFQGLDLSVAEYRNALAAAYTNKGIALAAQGTPAALAAAVDAHNEAIGLRRGLDPSVAEYHNALATACSNKGNALAAQGSPAALAAAVDAYDESIGLRRGLDLSVAEYRNDLAKACSNKGNALQAQGTPAALAAAVDAHDEAIGLRRGLDLSVAEYRSDLAAACLNKGNALRAQGTPAALAAAVDVYDEAIGLAAVPEDRPEDALRIDRAEAEAKAFNNKAIALLHLDDPMAAQDSADEGLSRLRELESHGLYTLRPLREILFGVTLTCSLAARQPQFLPEIILEHLDPDQPGSAPASAAMHRSAVNALQQGMAQYLQTPRQSHRAAELVPAAQRLAEIRALYFGGTAESARMQAEDLERRGDPDGARRVLQDYLAARPLDPEGRLAFAQFHARRRDWTAAGLCRQDAAALLVQQAPTDADRAGIATRVGWIAGLLLDRKLMTLAFDSPRGAADTRGLLAQSDALHAWLMRDFRDRLFAPIPGAPADPPDRDGWLPVLDAELDAVWVPFAEHRQGTLDAWLARADRQAREQAGQDLESMTLAMQRTLVAGLPVRWSGFAEALAHTWTEIWSARSQAWRAADPAGRERIESEIGTALAYRVAEESGKVADGELAEACGRLRDLLGRVWDQALADPERRFLAMALRCLGEDGLARYAGLELGLAVEWSLGHRLFAPLRAHWRAGAPERGAVKAAEYFGLAQAKRDIAVPLLGFLDGQRGQLDLGPMVAWLQKAITGLSPGETPAERQLREFVRGVMAALLPNPAPLLAPAPLVRVPRAQALEDLRKLRNDCAHPNEVPTRERLDGAWASVVADEADAFYRYFGLALLAPDAWG